MIGSEDVHGYVAAASTIGDPGAIWRTFHELRQRAGSEEAAATFAEILVDRFGWQSLMQLTPALSADILRRHPIFGASLALRTGRRALARDILASAIPRELPRARRAEWVQLIGEAYEPGEAVAVLRRLMDPDLIRSAKAALTVDPTAPARLLTSTTFAQAAADGPMPQ